MQTKHNYSLHTRSVASIYNYYMSTSLGLILFDIKWKRFSLGILVPRFLWENEKVLFSLQNSYPHLNTIELTKSFFPFPEFIPTFINWQKKKISRNRTQILLIKIDKVFFQENSHPHFLDKIDENFSPGELGRSFTSSVGIGTLVARSEMDNETNY